MADLRLPDMGSDFTARVPQTVRDQHTEGKRKVGQFLSGHETQPPKSVKREECIFVVRWYLNGAGLDKYGWDEAKVVGCKNVDGETVVTGQGWSVLTR